MLLVAGGLREPVISGQFSVNQKASESDVFEAFILFFMHREGWLLLFRFSNSIIMTRCPDSGKVCETSCFQGIKHGFSSK